VGLIIFILGQRAQRKRDHAPTGPKLIDPSELAQHKTSGSLELDESP
jgi:hypothetical protein